MSTLLGCMLILCLTGCIVTGSGQSILPERTGLVTLRGNPIALVGQPVNTGDAAPDFRAVDAGFKAVRLADFKGRVVLISAVPSLDTPVCSVQTKRFNEEAAGLSKDLVMITLSTDLPFAQKRFCEAEKVSNLLVLSDAVWREFGSQYGITIKDMGLLARSVWVIGKDGRVAYSQIVKETASEPDYAAALNAVRAASQAR